MRARPSAIVVLHSAPKREPNSGLASAAGKAGSTWCPSDSSSAAARRAAVAHSSCTGPPKGWWSSSPMRSDPGSAPSSSTYGRGGGGRDHGVADARAVHAVEQRAVSRTLRLTHSSTLRSLSSRNGPSVIRPCVGFSPTSPHADAGMRIDPPPSLACAIGTMPGGDGCRGAAARAARRAGGVPRVAGRPPRERLGGRHAAELGAVRPPGGDEAGGAEPADQRGVGRRDERGLLQRAVAVADRLAGVRGPQVLQQERHAAERAVGQVAGGGLAGVVEPADDDGVELRVDRLDPFDRRVEQLAAASPRRERTSAAWSVASSQRVSSAREVMRQVVAPAGSVPGSL